MKIENQRMPNQFTDTNPVKYKVIMIAEGNYLEYSLLMEKLLQIKLTPNLTCARPHGPDSDSNKQG